MNRWTVGVAVASLTIAGAAAGGAVAKPAGPGKKHAHVYHATLMPADVPTYAPYPTTRGKAQLVDGTKNDKISLHLRGAQPGQTYTWHVHQAPVCVAAPCEPTAGAAALAGWSYRPLKSDELGAANAKGTSTTFSFEPGATYYVEVHGPAGELLRGTLRSKQKVKPDKTIKP